MASWSQATCLPWAEPRALSVPCSEPPVQSFIPQVSLSLAPLVYLTSVVGPEIGCGPFLPGLEGLTREGTALWHVRPPGA